VQASPLIFVHYPKAAGTSILRQFEAAFGDRLFHDDDHRPLGPRGQEIAMSLDPKVACVFGHFRAARYDRLPHAVRATILRHPVDALISRYFFWLTCARHGNPIHERFLQERPDIEAFAAYPEFRNHMSEVYFGGVDMDRFDFIGFFEDLETDLARLARLAGVPLSIERHDNRSAVDDERRASLLANEAALARLARIVHDDIVFYDRQLARRRAVR